MKLITFVVDYINDTILVTSRLFCEFDPNKLNILLNSMFLRISIRQKNRDCSEIND